MRARFVLRALVVPASLAATVAASGCGSDDDGLVPDEPSLDDFLPAIPEPTGEDQRAWAGEIAGDGEIIPGPASTAMPGDFYIRNERGRFLIGAPERVIGVVPQGGNVIGAAPLDGDGEVVGGDQFGELSFLYVLGRTCEPDAVEVVRDGSGGGAAAIRATGIAAPNDYINLRGVGAFNVPTSQNPDVDDGVECAVTYTLEPGAPMLNVKWTLFNPGEGPIRGPFASLVDTGGDIGGFSPGQGFDRLGISAITSPGDARPADYVVYQGPGVSYGAMPVHDEPGTPNAHFLVAGVSVLLYGGESLVDILNEDRFHLDLPARSGVTHELDFMVARDASDVEAAFVAREGLQTHAVSGRVEWASGDPAAGARVGIYEDVSGTGEITGEDRIRTYARADAEGRFELELSEGAYLARAEVRDTSRSQTAAIAVPDDGELDLELPEPVVYDYTVTDGATGDPIPAKITVIGEHPARPDGQLFDAYDRVTGVVRMIHAIRGTSVIGTEPDEPLRLPAGSTYKVLATRGTEWSYDSALIDVESGQEPGELEFELWRVADTEGYVSSEYHVHAIGSPDSPVPEDVRVATGAAAGVEVFAQTDHDFVSDLQPVVEELGLSRHVRAIPGLEITPFVYGHFNAFPLEPDDASPNGGAVDWGRGEQGYAMLPGDIFDAARQRGADVVQVNHPRATGGGIESFQQYFDRAGLGFDYETPAIEGDPLDAPVPNEWLRLPGETSLWDEGFDAVELWNGFDIADLDEDGVRDTARLDIVMADWFNFLSFGLPVTPIGSSDTHTQFADPMGMPRTYVRVTDDSPAALETGRVVDDVVATVSGRGGPRDAVVTSAPHVEVTLPGEDDSLLGATLDAEADEVTLQIRAVAPSWAHLDTLEIYANATPPTGNEAGVLQPLVCLTSRDEASDPCAAAAVFETDSELVIETAFEHDDNPTGETFFQIDQEVTLTREQIQAATREGAASEDAWIVVRVRGNRGIYPLYLKGILGSGNLETFVSGSAGEQALILEERGVPAAAVTAPVYVIFEGAEYRAPFSP